MITAAQLRVRNRVQIVPCLGRHLGRIGEIERACFGRDAYPPELLLELRKECAGLFFIARRGRRIAGYCVTSISGPEAELVSIAVAPEHRMAGVAQALIRHTERHLRHRRVRTLVLMVRVGNTEALRLYRRIGFCLVGRIARYYEDRSDGLLMRKRL